MWGNSLTYSQKTFRNLFGNSLPCTYIGKSTRHVITRAKEHLNLGSSVKSKIKDHIIECNLCNKKDMDSLIHHFSVIKKCSSDYDCKIHEALIIKNINLN